MADSQYQAHVAALDELAGLASFHRIPILNGSESIYLEDRPPANALVLHAIPDVTVNGLGLAGTDLVSVDDSIAALSSLSIAMRAAESYRWLAREEIRLLLQP